MFASLDTSFVSGVLPILVFIVALGSLLVTLPGFFRDRAARRGAEDDRLALVREVSSQVMGREANPARGEQAMVGLVVIVPEIQRRVDELTREIGDRAELQHTSLLDMIQDIRDDVAKLARETETDLED